MKQLPWILLSITLVLLLGAAFWINNLKKQECPPPSNKDSLATALSNLIKAKDDTIKMHERYDSSLHIALDNSWHRYFEADNSYRTERNKTIFLVAKLDSAKKGSDSFNRGCDSLKTQALYLTLYADSLKTAADSTLSASRAVCDEKDQLIKAYESSLKSMENIANIAVSSANDYATNAVTYKRQAERKIVLGPSVGYGIGTQGKPKAFVGITLTYRLVRF